MTRSAATTRLWGALLALPLAASAAPAEMNATMVQRALEGTWVGDGTTLVVDTRRLQVNMNPDKPFEWKSLRLINVSGKMIVFDIGTMRYIALLDKPDSMRLTSPSFAGERALHLTQR